MLPIVVPSSGGVCSIAATSPAQVVFAVVGAIALCTAAFVNHRTLTHSTSSSPAYQRPQAPFGILRTPSIR
jgi:hypothetical protein